MNRPLALASLAFPLLLTVASGPASALSTVRIETPTPSPVIGASFQVQIVADFTAPIAGFGLDLGFDGSIISLEAPPTIGPSWVSAFTPDGDGLAGLAPGAAVSGSDVLLATLSFAADMLGVSDLVLGISVLDATEGFALDPSGFDSVSFVDGSVQVVPEPASGLLASLGLVALGLRRPSRRGRRASS